MFDGIFEAIEEWMRGLLTGMVESNLTTMFTDVNEKTGEIAAQVGQTPQGWNSSIFSLIQNLSDSVIVPIAGMIITFVLCYELISMFTEKNNMHEVDTWMFFKYFFKMWVAVYLVSHTFDITMAVFDVGQHIVNAAGGVIESDTAINIDTMLEQMKTAMESMEIGELVILALETMLVSLCMKIMSVLITVILYGRMIEIYLYTSVAPIPFSTMSNREWGQIGNNYFRGLFALGFQGFFMMVCVGIYAVLIATIRSREISASIILQSQSQLKTIYKDAAETILGNCDTMLFLGGKEGSTLKEISETLGKETIDFYNTSDTRGQSRSYGLNYQKTGKELMSRDELAVMDGDKCILQLRGVRPFYSNKFDITKHSRYRELSDYDKKNTFDVEAYLKHQFEIRKKEEFELFEVEGKQVDTEISEQV